MKTALLAATLLAFASPALAGPVTLKGEAADAFVALNFPKAEIPGEASGPFSYVRDGARHVGQATCSVPAMGARGDGAVSTCAIQY